jgi:GldM C-terminal domain
MKKVVFSLFFLSLTSMGLCQQVYIANPHERILYSDIGDNQLEIFAKEYSEDSLIVTTDNGKIEKHFNSKDSLFRHYYNISDLKDGTATITVKAKKSGKIKTIGTSYFKVEYWPEVEFKIGSGNRVIKRSELAEQDFVRAEYLGTGMDKKLNIDSFSIVAFRDHRALFFKKCYSNELDPETRSLLKTLQNGDQILFFDIWANDQHPARKLEDVEISIIE